MDLPAQRSTSSRILRTLVSSRRISLCESCIESIRLWNECDDVGFDRSDGAPDLPEKHLPSRHLYDCLMYLSDELRPGHLVLYRPRPCLPIL